MKTGLGSPHLAPIVPCEVIRRRDSLWQKLDNCLDHRLTIVQVGPGGGKTSFLASFAQARRDAARGATAWLTLDRLHRDRLQLLLDLLLALRTIRPALGTMTLGALAKRRDAPRRWDYLLELFCREVDEAAPGPTLLVLDQYEKLNPSAGATRTIDYLVGALPRDLVFVLASREPPILPSLSRLRTQGEVGNLGASDLYFAADEVSDLFRERLGFSIAPELVESLMAKTAGWPAMVQMAAMLAARNGEQAVLAFSGSLPEVYDYLDEEVFQPEAPGVRSFLLSTALVEQMSREVGQGMATDEEAAVALSRLERGGFFATNVGTAVAPLYRYNPVFRDFLLKKLQESVPAGQVGNLHRKLAELYSRAQQWDAAIHHFVTAGEYERAADLIVTVAQPAMAANKLETLAHWIDSFPPAERCRRPWLLLYRGVVHRVNREWEAALALYNQAADLFRQANDRPGLARALWYTGQVLAYRGRQRLAVRVTGEALTYLEPRDRSARAWILHIRGKCFLDLGQMEEALRCHREAAEIFAVMGNSRGEMMQSHASALALHRLGLLKEAQQHYLRALGLQARNGDVNTLCWVQAGLAHLRFLQGDEAEAEASLQEVVQMARDHHLRPAEAFALACLADVHLGLGDCAAAEDCCQQALAACTEFDDDAIAIELRLKRMEVDLLRGRLDLAREQNLRVGAAIAASDLALPRVAHALLKSAILLAEQQYDRAEAAASETRRLAEVIGARYHEAQACYLLAQLYHQQAKPRTGARLIADMLALAKDEGYTAFLLRDPQATATVLDGLLPAPLAGDELAAGAGELAERQAETAVAPPATEEPAAGACLMARRGELRRRVAAIFTGNDLPAAALPSVPPQVAASVPAEGALAAFLLGPLKLYRGGHLVTDRAWRTAKAKELFAYLLMRGTAGASRDELLDVLWPDASLDSAVSNFHFSLHSLRHAIEPHLRAGSLSRFLVLAGRRYRLEMSDRFWVDVREFEACVAAVTKLSLARVSERAMARLERAVELYQGDYLLDFYVDWAEPHRQRLLAAYVSALRQLAWFAYARREFDQASHHAHAVLDKDGFYEDAHRLLMRVACETGNPALALRQYDELVRLLQEELQAQPEQATRQLERQIRAGAYQRPALDSALFRETRARGQDSA